MIYFDENNDDEIKINQIVYYFVYSLLSSLNLLRKLLQLNPSHAIIDSTMSASHNYNNLAYLNTIRLKV